MTTPIQFKEVAGIFFKDYCFNSTLHGVRYFIVHVRHWSERLWWVVAIILSLLLSFLMIQSFWLDWQKYPSIETETNEMNAVSKIPFPKVIVCPPTLISHRKFDLSSKIDSKNQLLPNVSHEDKMRLLKLAHVCSPLRSVMRHSEYEFVDENFFNVIQDVAPDVKEITLSCSWKGAIINCSEYLEPVITENGVCFAFNGFNSRDMYTDAMAPGAMISKRNPNVSHWDLENGYEHKYGEEEYPLRVIDSDQITTLEINLVIDKRNDHHLCPMGLKDFIVFIMPPFETNLFMHKSVGVTLLKDTHIKVGSKLTTTSYGLRKYSPIRRQCFLQSERQLYFYKTYSHTNCALECLANFTKKYCGCVNFFMERDRNTKICGAKNANCHYEAMSKMSISERDECNCLYSCTSTEYSWEIERFPLNVIGSKQLNTSQQQARLRVSLQNLEVKTKQRIETVTITDFLAMCGGVLGLFIGFSALSLIELIYYPFLRLYWMVQRIKAEKDEEKSEKRKNKAVSSEKSNGNKNQAHSKKWKTRLRDFLLEYCDNSNIHGFRYFSQKLLHWTERCYWAIGCVVAISLCGWMTYNVWYQRQSNPAIIKPAKEKGITFITPLPTITICPEVKMMKQKLDLNLALSNLSSLSHIETQRLNAVANICPLLPHSVAFEDRFVDESIYNTIQDIAPQFDDILGGCNLNGKDGWIPCSTKMTPILTDEGLCFAFNALNSHDMYTNEVAPGMMMVTGNPNISRWNLENGYKSVFSHKDEYPKRLTFPIVIAHLFMALSIDKRNFVHQCNLYDGAFKLILTPPGEVLKMSRNYFSLHLKKLNSVTYEMKVTTASNELRKYTPNQRKCFFQSESRLRFFKMYTEANCEEECLANFTSIECGCVHFSMPRDNKTKVCGGASVDCMNAAQRKLQTDRTGLAFHRECNCLPACFSIKYRAKMQRIHTDMSIDESKTSGFAIIRIESVDADERVERFSIIDFLAYCGGLLGVCMGISVLSITEIVYFFTLRLFWIIRHWKSENPVVPLTHKINKVMPVEDKKE